MGRRRGTRRQRATLVPRRQAHCLLRQDWRRQERHRHRQRRCQRRGAAGGSDGNEPSAAARRRTAGLVARRFEDRVRISDAGARAADGSRPNHHHALLVSPGVRLWRAVQRQPAPPPLRRRCREQAGHAAHRRHQLRAFHRLVAGQQVARLPVQPRARPRLLLQLRHLHDRRRLKGREAADRNEEQ